METRDKAKGTLMDRTKIPDKNRLGRGLSALLPPSKVPSPAPEHLPEQEPSAADMPVQRLPLTAIVPNTLQPRQVFEPEALDDLAASVKAHGVLQPIMVRPLAAGRFELIAGERRFRAAEKAGLAEIPALVRTMTDEESLTVALIENIQREDLNAIEAARGYRQLLEQFSLTQVELAQQIGKSQPTIANMLSLLRLPEEIQDSISGGLLSAEHGKVLLSVRDHPRRLVIWRAAMDQHLSVNEMRALILQEAPEAGSRRASAPASAKDIHWQNLEDKLRAALGMKVGIKLGREGRGTLTIEFSDADEIEYLLEKIHSAP